MKILYHHRVVSKDGQYVHIEGMIFALRKLGHEVIVHAPDLVEGKEFGSESGWVHWLKRWIPRAVYELAELGYSLLDYVRLSAAIRKHCPDVIYERYNLYFLSGLWARHRYKRPWIIEVNAPLFDERSVHGGISLKRLARWTERAVWCGADHVFTVTEVLAQRVEMEGVSQERITVTPNGIDTELFGHLPSREMAKEKLGLDGRMILGFVGFIRKWHGLERIIKTLKELHGTCHFLLVGDGPAREGLEKLAGETRVDKSVTFTGIIDRTHIVRYINAFDIALQPDVVAYASPLKLFEYMAVGCAIVAPNRPNIREILEDGMNALLFDPDDDSAFYSCVMRLVNDLDLRIRLGEAAKESIRTRNLTWDGNASCVVTCAQELMAGNGIFTESGRRGE